VVLEDHQGRARLADEGRARDPGQPVRLKRPHLTYNVGDFLNLEARFLNPSR
jgi:hypothetical protein